MERKEELRFGGAAMSLPADLSCLQGGGGAEGEAALATLEKQLICPICLEIFSKPVVILPCQHNLCRKCANELYQPSLFQARTTMMVNSGRFRCPSCRHEVVLDRHGVYGLQRNLLVENIIDVYKQEVSNSSSTNTSSPLPLPPPPPQVTCSDHEGEKVNIYCLTCQVPTCSLCKVFGAHQTCQVAPLTDVYKQQKDELSEGISSLVTVNHKVQALIDELEETCRDIEENCNTQKQNVCDKFSRVFSVLEERRKAMTQRISSEEEEKTGHAQALVRCYGDTVEANSKLLERAASSMEEADQAAFVQNSRQLITEVLAATGSCPTETLKPGYENMRRYRYDFSRQERALRSIDFLRAVEEPEVEPEQEEEPKEMSVQSVEPHQEASVQTLEPVVEPVKEPVPAPMPPPLQTAAPTSAPAQPGPDVERDHVEPAGTVLQPDEPQLNGDGGSGRMKNKEEEEEETEEEEEEEEGCATADGVKEGNVCEPQEGMSTQQCEGGEAESAAADWPTEASRETQTRETDATFRPGWYKPNSLRRLCEVPGDSLSEAHPAARVDPEPQLHAQLYLPELLHHSDPQSQPLSPPHGSQSQPQEEPVELEEHEEEDVLGRAWDGRLSPAEGGSDLAGGRVSGNPESPSSTAAEETRPGLQSSSSELSDGRPEDAEEREDKSGEEGDEAEVMEKERVCSDERSEDQVEEPSGLQGDACAGDEGGVEIIGSFRKEGAEEEFDAGGSGFPEEDAESGEAPEGSEENITSCVSLQAVTLLFYLLAFLVILQRVWAYIGCFICT